MIKMGIFKSSKTDLPAGPDVPVEQVMAMKAQGYTNNQIIQSLQRDGYTSSQIFDAISQSEVPMQENTQYTDMQPINPGSMGLGVQQPMPLQQPLMGNIGGGTSNEELIEAIIDEKWNELVKDINKVIEWKQKADAKLQVMEQKINDLKDQFDKLHQALLGKIGEYDKNMLAVSTELQAMEKVFSKVLPTFMDNVNELSRITEKISSTSSAGKVSKEKKKVSKNFEEEQ